MNACYALEPTRMKTRWQVLFCSVGEGVQVYVRKVVTLAVNVCQEEK